MNPKSFSSFAQQILALNEVGMELAEQGDLPQALRTFSQGLALHRQSMPTSRVSAPQREMELLDATIKLQVFHDKDAVRTTTTTSRTTFLTPLAIPPIMLQERCQVGVSILLILNLCFCYQRRMDKQSLETAAKLYQSAFALYTRLGRGACCGPHVEVVACANLADLYLRLEVQGERQSQHQEIAQDYYRRILQVTQRSWLRSAAASAVEKVGDENHCPTTTACLTSSPLLDRLAQEAEYFLLSFISQSQKHTASAA